MTLRIAVCLLLCACSSKRTESEQSNAQLEAAKKTTAPQADKLSGTWPKWLPRVTGCPADALPASFTDQDFSLESCQGTRLGACLDRCEGGSAVDCYSAALLIEEPGSGPLTIAASLFARACKLGYPSACTNWSAKQKVDKDGLNDCQVRSFQAICDRSNDPWGCAMLAYGLAQRDPKKHAAAIKRAATAACADGEREDPCRAGRAAEQLAKPPD